jgi:hypothetical protein
VTTADPAAAVKHGRSLIQGIDHHIAARMRERRTMLGLMLTPTPLRRLADRLNDTPRRCLGYRTPREVFEHHLAAPTGPP